MPSPNGTGVVKLTLTADSSSEEDSSDDEMRGEYGGNGGEKATASDPRQDSQGHESSDDEMNDEGSFDLSGKSDDDSQNSMEPNLQGHESEDGSDDDYPSDGERRTPIYWTERPPSPANLDQWDSSIGSPARYTDPTLPSDDDDASEGMESGSDRESVVENPIDDGGVSPPDTSPIPSENEEDDAQDAGILLPANPKKRPFIEDVTFVDKADLWEAFDGQQPKPKKQKKLALLHPRTGAALPLNCREVGDIFEDSDTPTDANFADIAARIDNMCDGKQQMKERLLYTFHFMEGKTPDYAKAFNTLLRDPATLDATWNEMLENNYNTQMLWLKIYINTRDQEYVFANAPMMESLEDNASEFQQLLDYTLAGLDLADEDDREELFVKNYVKELCDEWPDCFEESQNLYTEYKTWMRTWGLRNCSEEYGWFQEQIVAWMTKQLKLKTEEMQRKTTPREDEQKPSQDFASEKHHLPGFFGGKQRKQLVKTIKTQTLALEKDLFDRIEKARDIEEILKSAARGCKFSDSRFYTFQNPRKGNSIVFDFDLAKKEKRMYTMAPSETIVSCCGNGKTAFYLTKNNTDTLTLHFPGLAGGAVEVACNGLLLNMKYVHGPFLCKNTNGVVVIANTIPSIIDGVSIKARTFANLYEEKDGGLALARQWLDFKVAGGNVQSCTYDHMFETLIVETKSDLIFVPGQGKHKTIKKPSGRAPYKYTIFPSKDITVSNSEGTDEHEISQNRNDQEEKSIYFIKTKLHEKINKNQFFLLLLDEYFWPHFQFIQFYSPNGEDRQYYKEYQTFLESDEYRLYADQQYMADEVEKEEIRIGKGEYTNNAEGEYSDDEDSEDDD
jgi:hypothetical protein